MDIYELMEFAQREIAARLEANDYTDDWQWNDKCFQFVVIWSDGKVTGPYRYAPYDEDAKEQLLDWLDERF